MKPDTEMSTKIKELKHRNIALATTPYLNIRITYCDGKTEDISHVLSYKPEQGVLKVRKHGKDIAYYFSLRMVEAAGHGLRLSWNENGEEQEMFEDSLL